jgi:hypothetical protein
LNNVAPGKNSCVGRVDVGAVEVVTQAEPDEPRARISGAGPVTVTVVESWLFVVSSRCCPDVSSNWRNIVGLSAITSDVKLTA